MMKAFQLSSYATDPSLNEVDTPHPGTNEVLVRVACAALTPLDVKLQSGAMHEYFPLTFPATVGTDLSGTIEALGTEVTGWTIGDRIVARTAPTVDGAMAEFAIVPADQLARLPDTIGFEAAAGIPMAAGTAWQALFEIAEVRAGQTSVRAFVSRPGKRTCGLEGSTRRMDASASSPSRPPTVPTKAAGA